VPDQPLFIRIRGRIQGPFGLAQLQDLSKQGRLGRLHEVSEDGTSWVQAAQFPTIFAREPLIEKAATEAQALAQPSTMSGQPNPALATPLAAPPAVGVSQHAWYYSTNGREQNTTSLDQLRFLIGTGQIGQDTMVWTEGMPQWLPARNVSQLLIAKAVPSSGSSNLGSEQISRATLDALSHTRPWVIFIAVFGCVVVGLTALSGISVLALGTVVNSARLVLQAVVTFLLMGLYCFISYLLLRYGIRIGRLELVSKPSQLNDALRAQHDFWRASGIALLVMIVIGAVTFGVLLYFGAIAIDSLRNPVVDRVT
jgi:hypothetical protein